MRAKEDKGCTGGNCRVFVVEQHAHRRNDGFRCPRLDEFVGPSPSSPGFTLMRTSKETRVRITLTKIDAGRRHLEAAIKLFFFDDDVVAVHTLAAASFNLLGQQKGTQLITGVVRREQSFVTASPVHPLFRISGDTNARRLVPGGRPYAQ